MKSYKKSNYHDIKIKMYVIHASQPFIYTCIFLNYRFTKFNIEN